MGITTCIGRVGALAVTLGVGLAVAAAPGVAESATGDSSDSTALLVCGTTCPAWHDADIARIMDQFITPTHPGQTLTPVAVRTPEEYWPITGIMRLLGSAVGDPTFFGPGGAAWPDAPWWKLSGLFDLTIDQSIRAGAADLETAMAEHGNDQLVIYGYSQGAAVVVAVKRRLAAQYPVGTQAPDISFVLGGDTNLPNGGLNSRFPGLYIPILDLTFNGPEPTDTQFHTDVINRQYDGAADFPLYPLNLIADLNAVLGFLYLHTYPFAVSLPADPTTSPAYQGTHGDSSYYFFETEDLPLFAPLRQLGVPEPLIDVVEPFFRVLVEMGYDRSIPPWEPTPARLIAPLDPGKVAADLVSAIGEGIDNAAALFRPPTPSVPGPKAPAASPAKAVQAESIQETSIETGASSDRMSEESTERPTEGDSSDPAIESTSERTKRPTSRSASLDPVVRDSRGTKPKSRGLSDRSTGPATSSTGAAVADSPTPKGSDSPSGDSESSADKSAGDDSGDSA